MNGIECEGKSANVEARVTGKITPLEQRLRESNYETGELRL